jgi:hypothetical protein
MCERTAVRTPRELSRDLPALPDNPTSPLPRSIPKVPIRITGNGTQNVDQLLAQAVP